MNPEFLEQVRTVGDRGLERDLQAMRDLFGRVAFRDQPKHFDFTRREPMEPFVRVMGSRFLGKVAAVNAGAAADGLECLLQNPAGVGNELPLQSAVLESLIQAVAGFSKIRQQLRDLCGAAHPIFLSKYRI
jgi:hypothetical protein